MRVVIVASGDLANGDQAWLDDADRLVAADGGAVTLERDGRTPDVLVGDLDSTDAATVDRLAAAGVRIERHPVDKEASDTELAVGAAIEAGATEVVILGALGGERLDHELANVLLLADPALTGLDVRIVRGTTVVRALRGGRRIELGGAPGDLVTLLPVGDAMGVTTSGLRWTLEAATLRSGRSRGLSNVVVQAPASVALDSGVLLVVETPTQGGTTS